MSRVPVTIGAPLLAMEEPKPTMQISEDFREIRALKTVDEVVRVSRLLIEDMTFPTVDAWTRSGRKAAAFFPVYTPQEIAHALGMLPVTIHGAGEAIEINHADAVLGSFLCSISKSTMELGLTKRLDKFGAFVFPYICDVSRNLEGIFGRRFPGKETFMLHMPQNFESRAAIPFLASEYQRLTHVLERAAGKRLDPDALLRSIAVYDGHRRLTRELADLKRREPWKLSLLESHLIMRLAHLVPREVHIEVLRNVLTDLKTRERPRRDAIRVLVVGPFCEHPTLDLVQLVEDTGCYAVDDELAMLPRWHGDTPKRPDPLEALAAAYIQTPVDIGIRKTPTTKEEAILARVAAAQAQGVVFLTAKFCEPAGEDLVLYRRALMAKNIPFLHLEFEERSSSFEQSRLSLETFVESIFFD